MQYVPMENSDNSPNTNDQIEKSSDGDVVEYKTMFHGPIPDPEVLAQYDRIVPGAADRILKMAEEQSAHRRDMEKQLVTSNTQNEKRGMYFAFVITIVFVLLSGFLIYHDKVIAGYLTLGSVIVGHAYNYISAKRSETEISVEQE